MNKLVDYLKESDWILYLLCIILIIPALFINLGMMPFISDEATRAVVALEMDISGDYITPTINGDFYYNKPPLYNWILILFTKIFGDWSELTFRIPTVLSLIGFGGIIYHFNKKHMDSNESLVTAFILITSGRILFWDSFQGLIDITFSMVIFLNFMIIYHQYKKGNYLRLFFMSWLLTAIAFLMKGLPAILFQGVTLLVLFISEKQFKKLFNWRHIISFSFFIFLVGGYYVLYNRGNSLELVFQRLFIESEQRTVFSKTILDTLTHIVYFPWQLFYEFAPWLVLLLVLIRKNAFKEIFKDDFLKYNFLIFLFNIPVYWLSPDFRPRYVFMLMPLLLTVLVSLFFRSRDFGYNVYRVISFVLGIILISAALLSWYMPYAPSLENIKAPWTIAVLLFLFFTFMSYLFFRLKFSQLIIVILTLLIVRVFFNKSILPLRYEAEERVEFREEAMQVGELTKGKPLYVFGTTPMDHDATFYISRERWDILKRKQTDYPDNAYYIIDDKNLKGLNEMGMPYEMVMDFQIKFKHTRVYLIKFE